MAIGDGPFRSASYSIAGVELVTMQPAQAQEAGALLASIDPWAGYPVTAGQLTQFFADIEPGAPRFAIRHGGGLAGALAIRIAWLRGPYIQTFGLAPSVQGRGIGSAVMAWIEGEARLAGDRNLWVAASDINDGARRFYARHGFETVAPIEGLLRDGRTEILMRKRLF